MPQRVRQVNSLLRIAIAALAICPAIAPIAVAENPSADTDSEGSSFATGIQPLLEKHCVRCHNVDEMTSGIRVDHLTGGFEDRQLFLWKDVLKQITDEAMPPEDEPQPTAEQRRIFSEWIRTGMTAAKNRDPQKNGSVRRLTVAQYRNTLRELLGIEDDLTAVLPPDAVSKDGFLNNEQTMLLSPLLLEAYFDIAEKALDRCIVDEKSKPVIQNFRMDFGAGVNPQPFPEKLILGANSHLLANQDFMVTELKPNKPFDFDPFKMRARYRFIEGYQGNATVRGWRDYDSIYHAVFACMRGTDGYPKGKAYEPIPDGLLLRPAIPSAELFQVESTYGPKANFKISLRELPDHGKFRVTVKAAKYDDGLLLDSGAESQTESNDRAITVRELDKPQTIEIEQAGIYQVDVYIQPKPPAKPQSLTLKLGSRQFSGTLHKAAFVAVRLPAGSLEVHAQYGGSSTPNRIVLTPLAETHEIANRFKVFEKRVPRIGVHVGLRRDCGSTLTQVGIAHNVASNKLAKYVFEGAISNYPSPDVEKDNVNYLAGVREIGVRSEHTDGRDMPRLLINSVEFEGPCYETWPPATHRSIFLDSKNRDNPEEYAREVIGAFATRAFRRPVTKTEERALVEIWQDSFRDNRDFQRSVKDALLVVLTSPQFLFLIENSQSPEAEVLDSYELASKLSYFLWNAAPDQQLLKLAATNSLHDSLDVEIDRMILDPRFEQFADEFTSQWLNLDKFDVVEVDRKRYPRLTRDTKTQLRQEPVRFLQYLIQGNLPLRNLVQSDFLVANEVVAGYYDLAHKTESGFDFVPIKHGNSNLGGVLAQAGILAGLSDGREANPVKRGAWLARKIIAEPPDDPPPNIPALEEDTSHLSLRQRLERHRNQPGCAKCHSGIDPWGIPFEQFDAGGLFKLNAKIDTRSTLPDETEVADFNALKKYLANDRIDQVAFGFLKHLSTYAIGRSLSYNEIEFLKEKGVELKVDEYRMQEMIRFVIKSKMFLEK